MFKNKKDNNYKALRKIEAKLKAGKSLTEEDRALCDEIRRTGKR